MQSEVNMPLNLKLIASMNASSGGTQNSVPGKYRVMEESRSSDYQLCNISYQLIFVFYLLLVCSIDFTLV